MDIRMDTKTCRAFPPSDRLVSCLIHLSNYYYISTMALNIKDPEAERLATEVAAMTGETKTRAVRVALQERRERLALRGAASGRAAGLMRFLEEEAWPQIPENLLGATVSREEREAILGYGPSGV